MDPNVKALVDAAGVTEEEEAEEEEETEEEKLQAIPLNSLPSAPNPPLFPSTPRLLSDGPSVQSGGRNLRSAVQLEAE